MVQKKKKDEQFSLSAQEALHQALKYLGGLSMEIVPLGYTQTGHLEKAKKRPI